MWEVMFLDTVVKIQKNWSKKQQLADPASKPSFWYKQWVRKRWTGSSREGLSQDQQRGRWVEHFPSNGCNETLSDFQCSSSQRRCLWIIKIFQFSLIRVSHILTFIFLQQSPVPNLCPQRKTCCVWMIPLSWRAAYSLHIHLCQKETHTSPYYKHQAHRDQRLLGRTEIQTTFGIIWISEFLRLVTEKRVTEINSLTSWSFKASHLMASREVCSINTYWSNQ